MATFITSKSVGQDITINVNTSTSYWKYNHNGSDSSVFSNGSQTITVVNANGEFTLIPCLSDGTVSGNITTLYLSNNQLTSFDGTGLSSLTFLNLDNNQFTSFDGTGLTSLNRLSLEFNQLTSFDGTGLTGLTELDLGINQLTSLSGFIFPASLTQLSLNNNQFTSFDGTGLSSLTFLNLHNNQLTSFDGTDLSSLIILNLVGNQLTTIDISSLTDLTDLDLSNNQLTSFDGTGLTSLTGLYLTGNQLTSSDNDQIINQLNQNGLWGGEFYTNGGRTWASNVDYDNLISSEWSLGGLDLVPTFITSKSVGQGITINVNTSTSYWKYNHNGSDSSVFSNGYQTITVANANGEFTIIPCLSNGTPSGDITQLYLNGNQITSFDGTGLTSLSYLDLSGNQFTSFDGTGLTSLIDLYLNGNQLTSFDGTGLTSLTQLDLGGNQLTSLNGTGLTSLTTLNLGGNQFTSFDGTGLTSLTYLNLGGNQLTSFDGTGLTSLTQLELYINQLTSFDGTGLTSLTQLYLGDNQLTSFDGTGLTSLTTLILYSNQLTTIDVSNLTSLTYLELFNTEYGSNPMTPESNNSVLSQLDNNGLSGGGFYTTGGRTSAGTADYDALVAKGWALSGLDLPTQPVTFITSTPSGESLMIDVTTSTGYWKYIFNGTESGVFPNGNTVRPGSETNNGDYTVISCDIDGNVSGEIEYLGLDNTYLTSFDGTGLTGLTSLNLASNQLTSFDGTGLSSLTSLNLAYNQLTSLSGFILPTSLTTLNLDHNQLTSFDGTGLTSLINLFLNVNPLTLFNGTDLTSLTTFILFEEKGSSSTITPELNNSILDQLNANGVESGNFFTSNGRTSAGTADYDSLVGKSWQLRGLDLVTPPPSGNGKLRIKGVNSGGGTTTTTTTEPVFYTYDFTSFGVEAKGEFANNFNKAGVTNWDGTYRIVATDLNTGTLVYYIGTDGDKHLFTFNNVIIQDASNGIIINETGINGITILGTVTFDSITPFVVTTTTTTTEAPTTTTTTTSLPFVPSLYWDNVTLGSVGTDGELSLNIDFTEYGFNDLSNSSGKRTVMVIPSTGPNTSTTIVMIDGVEQAIVPVSYFDNTINANMPSQDPTIGTINIGVLQDLISDGRVMTTDQVKLAAILQSGSKKSTGNNYIIDSVSSTIGTVQDILDMVPTTTTTTASGF